MNLLSRTELLCAAALTICAGANAQSIALIDNLAEPIRALTEVYDDSSTNLWAAQSFVADTTYSLDSITALLGGATSGTVPIAALYTGETVPEFLLTTLSVGPIPAGAVEPVVMLPDVPVTLVPGETYWVMLGVEVFGYYLFSYADTNNWAGPGAFEWYAYSFDAGGLWGPAGTDFPHQLRVDATPLTCYADCDASGSLDFFDFLCFQNEFGAGSAYADCDASGSLDFFDFLCFQNTFNLGCP